MRTLLMACAAILLISLPAMAYRSRPYLGVNLQLNDPSGDFAGKDFDQDEGVARSGGSLQLDLGMASRPMSVYVGVRGGTFDTDRQDGWKGTWTTNRFLLGLRGHLLAEPGAMVVPTLGGGVSVGRTTLKEDQRIGNTHFVATTESDASIGWFVEGGILARLSHSARLNADIQYHRFGAEFDFGDENFSDIRDFNISFVTLQLGVMVFLSE